METKPLSRGRAAAEVLLAGVLWGMINLFVRALSAAGAAPLQITFIRLAVAAVGFTLFLLFYAPRTLKIQLRDLWMFIGTGIVSVMLFNLCYFYAMTAGEASVAVTLLYTSPFFILLLAAALFGERITVKKIPLLLCLLLGCALTSGLVGSKVRFDAKVFLAGLGSGFFYGLYTIFSRFALKKYSALTVTAYTFITGALGLLPFAAPGKLVPLMIASPKPVLLCLGIGVICTVLPYVLYTHGLTGMEAGRAAVLAESEPVTGTLIGLTVFGESRDVFKLLGIVLILGAVLLLETDGIRKRKRQ